MESRTSSLGRLDSRSWNEVSGLQQSDGHLDVVEDEEGGAVNEDLAVRMVL